MPLRELSPGEQLDQVAPQLGAVAPSLNQVGSQLREIPADAALDEMRPQISGIASGTLPPPALGTDVPFKKRLDTRRGAPGGVRQIVGSINKPAWTAWPQSAGSTLTPNPMGMIISFFTDPTTKRATLYNPKGPDVGDLASVSREGQSLLGPLLGQRFLGRSHQRQQGSHCGRCRPRLASWGRASARLTIFCRTG